MRFAKGEVPITWLCSGNENDEFYLNTLFDGAHCIRVHVSKIYFVDQLEHRADYGRIDLVYSGSTYDDLVFKEQLFDVWPGEPDMHVHVLLYHEDARWDGEVAYTAPFLETLGLGPEDGRRVAVICGGPSLSRTCRESLLSAGFSEESILTTLEMRMKCGVGKCGRCNMGGHFICLDGPIFSLAEIATMHSDV